MRYFLAFLGLLASSAAPPAAFIDATAASRIGFIFAASKTPDEYLIEAMGGGVAMLDADGDGRLDAYFVNGASVRIAGASGQEQFGFVSTVGSYLSAHDKRRDRTVALFEIRWPSGLVQT